MGGNPKIPRREAETEAARFEADKAALSDDEVRGRTCGRRSMGGIKKGKG